MKSYWIAVAFIVVFILIAHLVVGEPYRWYEHTISQLAGQAYSNAWIMRIGFIGFGVLIQIAGIGRMRAAGRYWYREVPIMTYGLSVLASGIFSTTPFIEGVSYSEQEAQLHTLFASAGGIALTAGILLFMLTDAPNSRRVIHVIALALTMVLVFLFFSAPETVAGVMQRLLWTVGFAWLVYLGSDATLSQMAGEAVGSA
jgi:hypothetical membrane protein